MDDLDIFSAALELETPEERRKYLNDACGENALLRARIEALLRSAAEASRFMESPAPCLESPPTIDLAISEKPGDTIGPYKLLQHIGEGGMGVVYMAEQTQPVERRVALKIIKPGMDTRQVIARFEAERQALAMMDHPNIAKVLDAGTTATGRPYFVMELVKGLPITQYCDEQHLSPRQRLELFVPICQAVQHAHQKGIIHRDLKPSNILIARYDDKPIPKVIDFGVAKAISQPLTEKTMFTQYGQLVGTIDYMSPEQAQFNQLDVDTRSDIYSLGVLLYELLTGETPFDRTRLRTAAFEELLRIIREEEPPRPSIRLSSCGTIASIAANRQMEPHKLGTLVRGELDWIVMKALEKDRSRRYETATGLAHDIDRYLNDQPVEACPPSLTYRFRKFLRRNATAIITTAAVFIALACAVGGIGWALHSAADRHARLQREVEQALKEVEENYRSEKLNEAMVLLRRAENQLGTASGVENLAQQASEWRTDLEMMARLERIRLEQGAVTEDGKWDWSTADRAYHEAFQAYGLDIDLLEPSQAARQIQARRIKRELSLALDDWVAARRSIPGIEPTAWQRLVVVATAADPDPLRTRLRSLWGRKIADVRGEIEQLAELSSQQKLHPTTVILLYRVLKSAGFQKEAESVLSNGQSDYPSDFWLNVQRGLSLAETEPKREAEAIGFFRAALALRPEDGLVYAKLGMALSSLGQKAEAEQAHREAIRLAPKFAYPRYGLGHLFWKQHRWSEAIAAFEEAIQLEPRNPASYESLTYILANCPVRKLRNPHRARETAQSAINLSPQSSSYWQALGWAEYRAGNWQASVDALLKSCKLQGNPEQGNSYQWYFLAMAHWQLGNQEEAHNWYGRAARWTERHGFNNPDELGIQAEAAGLLGAPRPTKEFWLVYRQGRESLDAEQWAQAERWFRLAIEHWSSSALAHEMLGWSLEKQNRLEEAEAAYRQAVSLVPNEVISLRHLGNLLARQGRSAEAEPHFAAMTRLESANPQTHIWLGNALKDQGKSDEAIDAYQKALKSAELLGSEQRLLARIQRELYALLHAEGREREAEQLYHQARAGWEKLARNNDLHARWELAWFLVTWPDPKFRDAPMAIELAEQLIKEVPESRHYWRTLGAAHLRAGNCPAAITALEKAHKLRNGGAWDYFFLAMAHWQQGDKDQAQHWYDRGTKSLERLRSHEDVGEIVQFQAEAAKLMGITVQQPETTRKNQRSN